MGLGVFTRGINIILDIMKTSPYTIVPVHERPDLFMDCCRLINSEWPSSDTRRLRTLGMSCENFPTCLVLLNDDKVVGHCKVSLVPRLNDSCFIESVVIEFGCRSQGLGSKLLRGTEEYVLKKGIQKIYLATKGQEQFYMKNGYTTCEPINLFDCRSLTPTNTTTRSTFMQKQRYSGPPPPPLPILSFGSTRVKTSKTYMVKHL